MKKLLSFVLAFAIVICAAPLGAFTFTASAATRYTDGYYTYTIENDAATVTGFYTSISDAIIPDTANGYPVTSIGDETCQWLATLNDLTHSGDKIPAFLCNIYLTLYRTKVIIAKSYAHFCANIQMWKKDKKTLYKTKVVKYNNNIK